MKAFILISRNLGLLNLLLSGIILIGIVSPASFGIIHINEPRDEKDASRSQILRFIAAMENKFQIIGNPQRAKTLRKEARTELLTFFENAEENFYSISLNEDLKSSIEISIAQFTKDLLMNKQEGFQMHWSPDTSTLILRTEQDGRIQGEIKLNHQMFCPGNLKKKEIEDSSVKILRFSLLEKPDEAKSRRIRYSIKAGNIEGN